MAKREKKAISLTPEQTMRANKWAVMIYGTSFLGWFLLMLLCKNVTVVGIAVTVVCFALLAFWGLTRGGEENTHIKMSVMYLCPFL